MTARTTQPRSSKGPLGGRGRRLQERLGVVPLAAITRRGAVPVWLRASWSNPAVAAKAACQLANCRRHQGWSRSPSPCTRWGTRSLICARFQPDWGKPNVRLIGGREETDASRLARAAHGASRLPDHPGWRSPHRTWKIRAALADFPQDASWGRRVWKTPASPPDFPRTRSATRTGTGTEMGTGAQDQARRWGRARDLAPAPPVHIRALPAARLTALTPPGLTQYVRSGQFPK